jgi:hypothetical protein
MKGAGVRGAGPGFAAPPRAGVRGAAPGRGSPHGPGFAARGLRAMTAQPGASSVPAR